MKPSAECINGEIWWYGSERRSSLQQTVESALALRATFAVVEPDDWFYVAAQRIVADLDVAIRQAIEHAEIIAEQSVGMEALERL